MYAMGKPQEAEHVAKMADDTRGMIMAITEDSRRQRNRLIRRKVEDAAEVAAVAHIAVVVAEEAAESGIETKRGHPLGEVQWDSKVLAMTMATSTAKPCRQCSRR